MNNLQETNCSRKDDHFVVFARGSSVSYGGKKFDLTDVKIPMDAIWRGGIGYGGSGTKLLAKTTKILGDSEAVCNLPFCMEDCFNDNPQIVSETDKEAGVEARKYIREAIEKGFTHINIPLNMSEHVSLLSIVISEGKASLRFYDSLGPDAISYGERYNDSRLNFIKSMLPESLEIDDKHEVLHLLSQGDVRSSGCGYYALYVAKLITENEYIRNLTSVDPGFCLFDASHDDRIRAELIIKSMLADGLDNVAVDPASGRTVGRIDNYSRVDALYQKLDCGAALYLRNQLMKAQSTD